MVMLNYLNGNIFAISAGILNIFVDKVTYLLCILS